MKKITVLTLLIASASFLPACSRLDSPSMVNTTRPQLFPETTLQQQPVANVSEGYLQLIADNYVRYGTDTLQMQIAYDPDSKNYTAMKAFNDLAGFKSRLKKLGVRSVTAETVKAKGSDPTLMISYDAVKAEAPAGCQNMPGLSDGLTNAHISEYKFGCSVDTMLAKQIYRPADLAGNAGSDLGDGRRAANNVEYYRRVDQDEAEGELNRIQRTDIQE